MEAFDLRAISSVAPMIDLKAGLIVMLVGVLSAHVIVIPKLNLRSALPFLAISLLGLLAVAVTLAAFPAKFYLAGVLYAVAFVVWAGAVSRSSPNKFQLRRRAMAGSVSMLLGVAFAWWLAFAPR